MLKQVVLAHLEPVGTRFAYGKSQQAFKMGCLGTENGSKTRFSKSDRGPFGMLKQVFLARFEPVVMRFDPWKIPKCLANGLVWDQKWVKNRSKTRFSKSDPGQFGMLKQVFLAHFEPETGG